MSSFIIRHEALGFGDAVCLTAALRELRKRGYDYIGLECLRYKVIRELLWGNPDINAVRGIGEFQGNFIHDITANLWDYEQRVKPDVVKSRPQLFLDALDLTGSTRTHIYLTQQAKEWACEQLKLPDRPIIFFQTHVAESYKRCSWEKQASIIEALTREYYVLTFSDFLHSSPNLICFSNLPIYHVVALFSFCEAAIGYDSFFLHLSAALDIPFVALLGPTSCSGRVVNYPFAKAIPFFGCREPCFRNSTAPCHILGRHEPVMSHCLEEAPISLILKYLREVLSWSSK